MVIQVSADLYLHHTCLPLLMRILGLPLVRNIIFIFVTNSHLLHPPHLTWNFRPFSGKQIASFFTYLAYNCPRACTRITCSHVHPPQLTLSSPNLCSRATSVCVPLPHQLTCLYHDLSHACIGMSKIHLLHPYYMDDLSTTVYYPDMEHYSCQCSRLTTQEFCLSSLLTP